MEEEEGMEHVGDALAVAVGVMLASAGAYELVG